MPPEYWVYAMYGSLLLPFIFAPIDSDSNKPLEEFANELLVQYQAIKQLPLNKRFDEKQKWDSRLSLYLERCETENHIPELKLS